MGIFHMNDDNHHYGCHYHHEDQKNQNHYDQQDNQEHHQRHDQDKCDQRWLDLPAWPPWPDCAQADPCNAHLFIFFAVLKVMLMALMM